MSYALGCFGKGCIYNAIVEAVDEVETCTLGPYITTCYVSTTNSFIGAVAIFFSNVSLQAI